MDPTKTYTAFDGHRRAVSGNRAEVALAAKALLYQRPTSSVLIFDDTTGAQIDFDLRGTDSEVAARLREAEPIPETSRGPGRPRLGVVAREVTLLPLHWEWLAAQRGGASVALRRLVEAARKSDGETSDKRAAVERAYRFMSAMAGDYPNFEEASRALFAGKRDEFRMLIDAWPPDVRGYIERLSIS